MVFEDGSKFCARCKYSEGDGVNSLQEELSVDKQDEIEALPHGASRGVKPSVAEEYNVRYSGDAEYYPVFSNGEQIGWKEKKYPKSFRIYGSGKDPQLFGQWRYPQVGKRIIITGGELDALSAFQMLREKYPGTNPHVVSLPNGENVKSIEANYDWINRYPEVIVCTDMDEVGQKVAAEISQIFTGKTRIMELARKDANDMLQEDMVEEFFRAFSGAKEVVPEGIFSGADIPFEEVYKSSMHGYSLPYPTLQNKLHGLRKGEITTLTAGSGIGKSTMAREIMYHLMNNHELTLGNIFLEETFDKTILSYIALDNNIPLALLREDHTVLEESKAKESHEKLIANGRWWGLRHFGSIKADSLMEKLRYLAVIKKCDFICIDHLSMVISGLLTSDERKDIDILMTKLAAFVNETGVGIINIVHLKRNGNKSSFNEGGKVSLNDLRGSAALEQLSWNVLALERDQQDEEATDASQIRILKNREWGVTGLADTCAYNHRTGRHYAYVSDGEV